MSDFAYGSGYDENDDWDEVEEDNNEITNDITIIDDDVIDSSSLKIYEMGDVEYK